MSAAAVLDFGPIDLPGPTGESNQYELKPRGVALCLGPDAGTAMAQAVQALAAGNRVLAAAPGAIANFGSLRRSGFPLAVLDGRPDPEALSDLPVDLVAYAGPDATLLRQALADRDGPIVPLVNESIAPAAYCHERAICIDTTAAGGNASLLAEAGE